MRSIGATWRDGGRRVCWAWLVVATLPTLTVADVAETYRAHDTLGEMADEQPTAAAVLRQVAWEAEAFEVTVERLAQRYDFDAVVRFPSARPVDEGEGDAERDVVPLLWYMARDDGGALLDAPAPAVLVVHTVHPQLLVGKTIARTFARQGLHAFVLQLPGFGDRAQLGVPPAVVLFERADQAVADVRRARDAVAALPAVAAGSIALQATSLGGFVAAVAASLDGAFSPVMLALTGGDSFDVLQNGRHDAEQVRWTLARHGYVGDRLRSRLDLIEPLHVVHRLNPADTWLFTGQLDQVIPPANADALARAVGLPDEQHIRLQADHYSAALHLATITKRMTALVREHALHNSSPKPE